MNSWEAWSAIAYGVENVKGLDLFDDVMPQFTEYKQQKNTDQGSVDLQNVNGKNVFMVDIYTAITKKRWIDFHLENIEVKLPFINGHEPIRYELIGNYGTKNEVVIESIEQEHLGPLRSLTDFAKTLPFTCLFRQSLPVFRNTYLKITMDFDDLCFNRHVMEYKLTTTTHLETEKYRRYVAELAPYKLPENREMKFNDKLRCYWHGISTGFLYKGSKLTNFILRINDHELEAMTTEPVTTDGEYYYIRFKYPLNLSRIDRVDLIGDYSCISNIWCLRWDVLVSTKRVWYKQFSDIWNKMLKDEAVPILRLPESKKADHPKSTQEIFEYIKKYAPRFQKNTEKSSEPECAPSLPEERERAV